MSEAEQRGEARAFGPDDARELARSIIESEAGRECRWSATAIETVAAVILWEVKKGPGE
jgi:hypothetical protein